MPKPSDAAASNLTNATKIARETLRRLAVSRIEPTPGNYSRIYREIAGTETDAPALSNGATSTQTHAGDDVATGGAVDSDAIGLLQGMLRDSFANAVLPYVQNSSDLYSRGERLLKAVAEPVSGKAAERLAKEAERFFTRLKMRERRETELTQALARLLRLMVSNVGDMVADDAWLSGQVKLLENALGEPLDARELHDAERRLKQLVSQQALRKSGLAEAQEQLKRMLGMFVERLGQMSESTGTYQQRIRDISAKVGETQDLRELSDVLSDLVSYTDDIQGNLTRSRDELVQARATVETTQHRIQQLEEELTELSERVREDPLTESLNRRGLEEAYRRETARSQRKSSPLSVAIIDIDHFKKLNDTYGHLAGDQALVHLVDVIKSTVRPTDQLARIGGEEFVLLLADTKGADAQIALTRIQRELTKRMFMHNDERKLITFSAGVTEYRAGEELRAVLERADEALYQAKEQGRNRVIIG